MKLKLLILSASVFLIFLVFFSFASSDGTVTIEINSTNVWWEDGLKVNGSATYSNGSAVAGTAYVYLNDMWYCQGAISAGVYNCEFSAPQEIGSYALKVKVINATGSTFSNTSTSTITVKASYGETAIGSIDRVVYEIPMLIQDLNGKVKYAIARVMIWRS